MKLDASLDIFELSAIEPKSRVLGGESVNIGIKGPAAERELANQINGGLGRAVDIDIRPLPPPPPQKLPLEQDVTPGENNKNEIARMMTVDSPRGHGGVHVGGDTLEKGGEQGERLSKWMSMDSVQSEGDHGEGTNMYKTTPGHTPQ